MELSNYIAGFVQNEQAEVWFNSHRKNRDSHTASYMVTMLLISELLKISSMLNKISGNTEFGLQEWELSSEEGHHPHPQHLVSDSCVL